MGSGFRRSGFYRGTVLRFREKGSRSLPSALEAVDLNFRTTEEPPKSKKGADEPPCQSCLKVSKGEP